MSVKSILIIGFGSAGKRFAGILAAKGFRIYIFKHRKFPLPKKYFPQDTLGNLGLFHCIFIASPTSLHAYYLDKVAYSNIPVFIEKPITDNFSEAKRLVDTARRRKIKLQVGFNLRYLPVVVKINDYLKNDMLGKILHVDLYVGQYLPDWRPDKDYRRTYSASFAAGGGVALDLIHEIDLVQMWFGGVDLKLVRSAKLSELEIDTEDFTQFVTESRPFIGVTLDYLNIIKTRRYIIVGSEGSIECDVFNRRFTFKTKGGRGEILTDKNLFDIKKTYDSEIDDFLGKIDGRKKFDLSDRSLGLDSLKLAVKARKHVQG